MSHSKPQGHLAPGAPFKHEQSTINVRTIAVSALSLAAAVALTQLTLGFAMRWISGVESRIDEQYPERHAIEVDQFPTPRLQSAPHEQLANLKQRELTRLTSFGWVDQTKGIAHIPIDRALDILAKNGLPKIAAPELKPGEVAPIGVSPLPSNRGDIMPSGPPSEKTKDSPQ